MSTDYNNLVSKVWNYANILRDQGVSYGDYLEQITYLLFLKMDEERSELLNESSLIPSQWRWSELMNRDGDELELHYRHTLEDLSRQNGIIGTIFKKAQNKIADPAKLRRIVSLIGNEGPWIGIGIDVKGTIYEGLLERNAQEVKSGAGQYFTPRPLIDALVQCINPQIDETISDPACGTGGFLLSAYDHMKSQTNDRDKLKFLREKTFSGTDIVNDVVRLCAMNLYLHGISNGDSPVHQGDSLSADSGVRYDIVLSNPPFGKKSSYQIIGDDGGIRSERESYEREDFKFTTSNKQFNFLQHIMTTLKTHGRAAVVLPDNVLFEAGQAGEGIRKRLLEQFNFHTLLRLPTGIFYRPGVKANVLFFDKKPASKENWTKALWIYDLRTNNNFTLKNKPLAQSDLEDFISCYQQGNFTARKESERFKCFSYEEIGNRDKLNLDIFWLKDDSLEDVDNLPLPDKIAAEIIDNLEDALDQFRAVLEKLEPVL
jgi:type I restriction enzyme M protein